MLLSVAALIVLEVQPAEPAPSETAVQDYERAPQRRRVEVRRQSWAAEQRRLQIRAGLSGGFAAAMALSGALLLATLDACRGVGAYDDCSPLTRLIVGSTLLPLALIPTGTGIYYGVKLHRHYAAHPAVVLRPGPGGLTLHF